MKGGAAVLAAAAAVAVCAGPAAPPARALDLAKPICTLAGLVSTLAGKLCSVAGHAGRVLQAGKKLLGGRLGGAVETLAGSSPAVKALSVGVVVAGLAAWVAGGSRAVLAATSKVIAATTRPQLESTWFSSSYWRMAGISALLTLPFLFAAAVQALLRSDVTLLARAAFGYLPLGLLAVGVAAPLAMLLLAASDQLSALIAGASGGGPAAALTKVGFVSGGLSGIAGSTFLVFFVGLLTVAATVLLWIELLVRAAAIYVVVLMLPLFFAALVWPARRVWAARAIELLVALILSKFAIVAVLALGGAAIGHTVLPSITASLAGATLVLLAAFSPWALLRLLPLHELTAGLEGLRGHSQAIVSGTGASAGEPERIFEIAQAIVRELPAGAAAHTVGGGSGNAEPAAAPSALAGLDHEEIAGASGSERLGSTSEAAAEESAQVPVAGVTASAAPSNSAASSNSAAPPSSAAPPASAVFDSAGLAAAAPTDPAGAGEEAQTAPESERRPGLAPIFQAEDFAHPTIVFGPDSLPDPVASEPPELPAPPAPPEPPAAGSPAQ